LVSDHQFIAYVEGQLSLNEVIELEKSCDTNSVLLSELARYKKTIIEADKTIVFPYKQKLKRHPKLIWFNFSNIHYAAAACILFLIGLFILWPQEHNSNNLSIASSSNHHKTLNNTIKSHNSKGEINGKQFNVSSC